MIGVNGQSKVDDDFMTGRCNEGKHWVGEIVPAMKCLYKQQNGHHSTVQDTRSSDIVYLMVSKGYSKTWDDIKVAVL